MFIIRGRMKHNKGKTFSVLVAVLLFSIYCFSPKVYASASELNVTKEVRVPITLEVPHAIAGAEFEIECTAGLKLISLEKSETIATAYTTPKVEKNGKTYFGFYQESNDYEPGNGVLDIGFLVFEHSEEPGQYILVTEAKYVQVIDKDNTNSEVLILNEKIEVPLPEESEQVEDEPEDSEPEESEQVEDEPEDSEQEPGPKTGEKSYTFWIVIWIVSAAALAVTALLEKKKRAERPLLT